MSAREYTAAARPPGADATLSLVVLEILAVVFAGLALVVSVLAYLTSRRAATASETSAGAATRSADASERSASAAEQTAGLQAAAEERRQADEARPEFELGRIDARMGLIAACPLILTKAPTPLRSATVTISGQANGLHEVGKPPVTQTEPGVVEWDHPKEMEPLVLAFRKTGDPVLLEIDAVDVSGRHWPVPVRFQVKNKGWGPLS